MTLYELYKVLTDYTKVHLYNSIGERIYSGYLSDLDNSTLEYLVLRITPVSSTEIFVGIDTDESDV